MRQKFFALLPSLVPIFLIIFLVITYSGLGKNYLFDWDESIYAQLGIEMRRTHDLLTPTWNHSLWLEKPPLIAYLTALGTSLFSSVELGSRIFMPLLSAVVLYFVYVIGSTFGGSTAGLISMSLLGYFNLYLSRTVTVNTDILLLLGIVLAVFAALKNKPPLLLALSITLAIFAKGAAGLLALLIVIPLLLAKSKTYLLHTTYYILAFTLPWHLYQLLVHGSAFYTPYFLEQVITRAVSPIEFHLESRWFYFAYLYKDLGLGILLTATLGAVWLKKEARFLLWWVLLPLGLFTLARTRLAWYSLPVYPAVALLIGLLFARLTTSKNQAIIAIIALGIMLQTLLHSLQYVAPSRTPVTLPDQLIIAQSLSKLPGDCIAYLVSSSERTAEAILPKSQRISSSFRYGGSPSFVLYSQKLVNFYYNYDDFYHDLSTARCDLAVVTPADIEHIPSNFVLVASTNSYLGYKRSSQYAQR